MKITIPKDQVDQVKAALGTNPDLAPLVAKMEVSQANASQNLTAAELQAVVYMLDLGLATIIGLQDRREAARDALPKLKRMLDVQRNREAAEEGGR